MRFYIALAIACAIVACSQHSESAIPPTIMVPQPFRSLSPTAHPSSIATSFPVTESGAVHAKDIWGSCCPMIVVYPGSPYSAIDVYMTGADKFAVGQQVIAKGTYIKNTAGNQWIDATSITLASASPTPTPSATPKPSPTPTPSAVATRAFDHVTIIMEENHSYSDIVGSSSAPYINSLISQGALMTQSYDVGHPSEPNYMAIYSGSTWGLLGTDNCPVGPFSPSLGGRVLNAGLTIKGYFEDLPSTGSTVCTYAKYARKHNPMPNTGDTPGADWLPFGYFASALAGAYPNVSFVVPNLCDDMHDCSVSTGDTWLANHVPAILSYDNGHRGLLIIQWDEGSSGGDHIPTILLGPMVTVGRYSQTINHYNVLRTVTNDFGLSALNSAGPITGVFH